MFLVYGCGYCLYSSRRLVHWCLVLLQRTLAEQYQSQHPHLLRRASTAVSTASFADELATIDEPSTGNSAADIAPVVVLALSEAPAVSKGRTPPCCRYSEVLLMCDELRTTIGAMASVCHDRKVND